MIASLCRPGLFRLFLAVVVVVSHLSRFDVGRIAVLLFFFLSGFWVANIWDTKFKGEPIRFYLARTLRIYPLYWLVASFAVFAFPAPLSLSNFIIFGIANAAGDPVGVSWSLDIEMQFYLLLPLLILLPTKVLLSGSLALSAICWRFLPVPTLALYLPAFALGVSCNINHWRPSAPVAAGSVAAFLAASVVAFVFAPGFLNKTVPDPLHFVDIFSFFWMLPLLPFVAWSLGLKSTRFDRQLGNISYPLYLVHAWSLRCSSAVPSRCCSRRRLPSRSWCTPRSIGRSMRSG